MKPAIWKAIVESVENGAHQKHAAEAAGISEATLYRWLDADESLREQLTRAQGAKFSKAARVLFSGLDDEDPRIRKETAVEVLKRGAPQEWSATKIQRVEIEAGVHTVLDAVRPHMSREAYGELVVALARVQGLDTGTAEDAARDTH